MMSKHYETGSVFSKKKKASTNVLKETIFMSKKMTDKKIPFSMFMFNKMT